MKALSVRQPWAWAIFYAGKDIENRSYKIKNCPETIAIHVATRRDSLDKLPSGVSRPRLEDLVTGVIIGVVDVVEVVDRHESKWFTGPLGWVLRNPRVLTEPIEYTGARRIWEVKPEVVRTIRPLLSI
jgi:hypothetical protein